MDAGTFVETPQSPGGTAGFEIVEKDHAVEAMAYYIAQCLAKHPDAQVMSPKQLQEALGSALKASAKPDTSACSVRHAMLCYPACVCHAFTSVLPCCAAQSMKQSKFRRLCTLGTKAYRWTTLSYSALQVYQNPWLVQAVLTALWTFSRIGARAFLP